MIPVGRTTSWLLVTVKQVNQLFVHYLKSKEFLRRKTCVLYICCNWTKASTVAGIAKMLEEKVQWHTIIVAANASDPARCKFMPFAGAAIENILEIQVVQL
jgi:F0F1-type ATP synthase alpha subunit